MSQLEALCGWFEKAVTEELVGELRIIRFFDRAKEAMRGVVDMPDKLERLFLKLAFHNFERGDGFVVGASKQKNTSPRWMPKTSVACSKLGPG